MPNVARWRLLDEAEFAQLVAESHSFYELAEKIGYAKMGGGTQSSLKKAMLERGLDTSHFTGQAWNKGNYDYSTFTRGSVKKNGKTTLKPLIALRGHKCEQCGLTEWLNQPINLEIHHKNGDRSDNSLDNLILLCPNCHSYTETFCYKSRKANIAEEDFVQALRESKSIYQALLQLGLTASAGNYVRARELISRYNILHLQEEHQSWKLSE